MYTSSEVRGRRFWRLNRNLQGFTHTGAGLILAGKGVQHTWLSATVELS